MLRFVNTWITLIAVLAIAGGLFGVTEQAIAVERAWNLSIQPDSYQIDGANGGRIQPTVGASYRMGPGQTVVGIYDQDWRCLDAQVVEWQRDGQEHDGAFRAQWPGQIFVHGGQGRQTFHLSVAIIGQPPADPSSGHANHRAETVLDFTVEYQGGQPRLNAVAGLDFGQAVVGNWEERWFLITNTGDADLTVHPLRTEGDDPNQFSVQNPWGQDIVIAPGENNARRVTVRFSPNAARNFRATLVITSDGGNQNVALTGSGQAQEHNPVIHQPSEAEAVDRQVDEGQPITIDFSANDADDGQLTWTISDQGGLPNGYQFTDNRNGTAQFVWTPNNQQAGVYHPVFTVADPTGRTDVITVNLTVNDVAQQGGRDLDVGLISCEAGEGHVWTSNDGNVWTAVGVKLGPTEDGYHFLGLGDNSQVTINQAEETATVDRHGAITLSSLHNDLIYAWSEDSEIDELDPEAGTLTLRGAATVANGNQFLPVVLNRGLDIGDIHLVTVDLVGMGFSGSFKVELPLFDPLRETTYSQSFSPDGAIQGASLAMRGGASLTVPGLVQIVIGEGGGIAGINWPAHVVELGARLNVAQIQLFNNENAPSYTIKPLDQAFRQALNVKQRGLDILNAGFDFRYNWQTHRLELPARNAAQINIPFPDNPELEVGLGVAIYGTQDNPSWIDINRPGQDWEMNATGSFILDLGISIDALGATIVTDRAEQELHVRPHVLNLGERWAIDAPDLVMTRGNRIAWQVAGAFAGFGLPPLSAATLFIYNLGFDEQGQARIPLLQFEGTADCRGWPLMGTFVPDNEHLVSDVCQIDLDDQNNNVCQMPLTFNASANDRNYHGHTTADTRINGILIPANTDYTIRPDGAMLFDDRYAGVCRIIYPRHRGNGRDDANERVPIDLYGFMTDGHIIGVSSADRTSVTITATSGDQHRRIVIRPDGTYTINWSGATVSIVPVGEDRYYTVNIPNAAETFVVSLSGNTTLYQAISDWTAVTCTFAKYVVDGLDEGQHGQLNVDGQGNYVVQVGDRRIGPVEDEFGVINLDLTRLAIYRQAGQWTGNGYAVQCFTTQLNQISCEMQIFHQLGQLDQVIGMELVQVGNQQVWQVNWADCESGDFFRLVARDAAGDSAATEIRQVSPNYIHEITLARGWNLMSFYFQPIEQDLPILFQGVADHVELIKDAQGHFYAPHVADGFSNMPAVDFRQGYQLKASDDFAAYLAGSEVSADQPIHLVNGWNMIAYFPAEEMAVQDALQNIIGDVVIVKDGQGRFFAPRVAGGFSNMLPLTRGQGYQIRTSAEVNLIYPHGQRDRVQAAPEFVTTLSHFQIPIVTGSNMSLLVLGNPTMAGWEVAVYDPAGQLVGAGVFGKDGRCGLAAWSDDLTTNEVDGLKEGEAISFVLWSGQEEIPFHGLEVVTYQTDGLAVVSAINVKPLPEVFGLNAYPNPFNGTLRIGFDLSVRQQVKVAIYDLSGRQVVQLADGWYPAGSHQISFIGDNLAAGVYLIRFQSEQYTAVHKILLLK